MKTRTTTVLCASILLITAGGILATRARPVPPPPPSVSQAGVNQIGDALNGLLAPDPENKQHPIHLNTLADIALNPGSEVGLSASTTLANQINAGGVNADLACIVSMSRRLYMYNYPALREAIRNRLPILARDPANAPHIEEFGRLERTLK